MKIRALLSAGTGPGRSHPAPSLSPSSAWARGLDRGAAGTLSVGPQALLPILIAQLLSLSLHFTVGGVLWSRSPMDSGAPSLASRPSLARHAVRMAGPAEVQRWVRDAVDDPVADPAIGTDSDAASAATPQSADPLAPIEAAFVPLPEEIQLLASGLSPSPVDADGQPPVLAAGVLAMDPADRAPADSSQAAAEPQRPATPSQPNAEEAGPDQAQPSGSPQDQGAKPTEEVSQRPPEPAPEEAAEEVQPSPAASSSAASDAAPKLIDLGERDVLSLLLSGEMPRYPLVERRLGHGGVVLLRLELDSRGQVLSAELEGSSGRERLDRAALDAARRWVFDPSVLQGLGFGQRLFLPIRFELRRGP
jgi:protein TonB